MQTKMDKSKVPTTQDMRAYVNNPLWDSLCEYIEITYQIKPIFEYSRCAVPGWNVKYRKAGRSLCTLYPMEGYFVTLIVISEKEKEEMERFLKSCTQYMNQLYQDTKEGMGQKWLMIEVDDEKEVEDIKGCISIRQKIK